MSESGFYAAFGRYLHKAGLSGLEYRNQRIENRELCDLQSKRNSS